jgi:hypothetical protein
VSDLASLSPASGRLWRLIDWMILVLTVLAIGPAIGGFLVGVFLNALYLMLHGVFSWSYLATGIGLPVSFSYYWGEPIAALALIIFIPLIHLLQIRSMYLAILSGMLSTVVIVIADAIWKYGDAFPSRIAHLWGFLLTLIIISAASAAICWRITKPLQNLP